MIKSILFFATLLTAFSLSAQEKPLAKVHYNFKHVNDTNQRDQPIRDEVVTYLGQHSTYYTSYSNSRVSEEIKKIQSSAGFDGNIKLTKSASPISRYILLNTNDKSLKEIPRVAMDYFILDTKFPEQDWEIQEETKVIGGYTCQKATTDFKGRHYTAWFTTELPFPYGPWKLHGLPGLILSASDDKNEVSFEYEGFDKMPEDTDIKIEFPMGAIESTEEHILKLQKAYEANPQAYMQSKIGSTTRSGAKITNIVVGARASSSSSASGIKSVSVTSDPNYKPSKITNNPIELKP
ncbi:hypothetical protein GCM10022216_15020 [Sphingobacterium kyonggiense]|uniref:GLPGLI family protein n=1 Tax=Sphingobacterium kyonggiense TaxID=714075 RepID=A0ABP7YLX7_9SPHI